MIGSNPVHLTPTFSHEVQAGNFWSQRFLRTLQRLQAETFRNEDDAVAGCAGGSKEDEYEVRVGGVTDSRDGRSPVLALESRALLCGVMASTLGFRSRTRTALVARNPGRGLMMPREEAKQVGGT